MANDIAGAFALSALVLCGCDGRAKIAEDAVRARLKDPGSAQFARERVAGKGVTCGIVNAKDSEGHYTGFRRFYVLNDPPRAWIDIGAYNPAGPYNENAIPPLNVRYDYSWNLVGCAQKPK